MRGFGRFKDALKKVASDIEIEDVKIIEASKEHPKVFPYFITRLAPALYHITILPNLENQKDLLNFVIEQHALNDLETCLVLGEKQSIYLKDKTVNISEDRPSGGVLIIGQLFISIDLLECIDVDSSYWERSNIVQEYIKAQSNNGHMFDGYMFGDLTKGGREATGEELEELEKPNKQYPKVPNGLTLCEKCFEFKGTCLDPSENFKNQIMTVYCKCDNQNRCAKCKNLIYDHKLFANYYNKEDGKIWHVPGFCGIPSHKCSWNN